MFNNQWINLSASVALRALREINSKWGGENVQYSIFDVQ